MRKKLLTFFAAVIACFAFPALSRAEMTITWDFSAMGSWSLRYNNEWYPSSFSSDGITLTVNNSNGEVNNNPYGKYFYSYSSPGECGGEFTFSCATANITRIEITCDYTPYSIKCSSSGWSIVSSKLVWTGSASSVDFEEGGVTATQIVFTTDEEVAADKLSGVFSVSPCKSVKFSKGNLQYQASTDSWRFANKQYEVIGNNPGNTTNSGRNSQSAWIDLFGWGTGNDPSKADGYSGGYSSYTEWGEQFDAENGWYALSYEEWQYLLGGRDEYDPYYNPNPGVSYALGTVNGVGGLILLPDDWSTTYYTINNPNPTTSYYYPYTLSASYSDNVITLSDWTTYLEAHGAVFLPATGIRRDPPSMSVEGSDYGNYWTSTPASMSSYSYSLLFGDAQLELSEHSDRYLGRAVRLVSTYQTKPDASVATAPTAKTGLVYNGNWQDLVNTGEANGGRLIFSEYSSSLEMGSEYSPSEINAGSYTVYYMVHGDDEHCDFVPSSNSISVTIDKANSAITLTPSAITGLEYTGSAQTLINAGSATGGTMQYKLGNGSWGTSLPQATEVGDYTVWYRVAGNGNYYGINEASFVVSIAAPSVVELTANLDPQHAGTYYSTFYHSNIKYELSSGVEAYTATVSGDALILAKIAEGGQVIPADNAVILKASGSSITLTPSDESPVSAGENSLIGTSSNLTNPKYGSIYVLSAEDNIVAFYKLANGATIPAHKAYIDLSGVSSAPRRLRFVFDAATDIESVQPSAVSIQKVLRDGQLVIIRNGVEYNANGQTVK